jgi:hypothetical protein
MSGSATRKTSVDPLLGGLHPVRVLSQRRLDQLEGDLGLHSFIAMKPEAIYGTPCSKRPIVNG